MPVFIRIAEEQCAGNPLGNLLAYPQAGLAIPDFETGDLLQVTGSAEIVWEGPLIEAFPRAERSGGCGRLG